jgi:multidrug efflux pump
MGQISGAIIGVTVVLISVFVPLAFFSGSVGNIYRQFSAVMVSSIAFSAFLALSLTPALCATLLRSRPATTMRRRASSAGSTAASAALPRATKAGWPLLKRAGRYMVIYAAIGAAARGGVPAPAHLLPAQ